MSKVPLKKTPVPLNPQTTADSKKRKRQDALPESEMPPFAAALKLFSHVWKINDIAQVDYLCQVYTVWPAALQAAFFELLIGEDLSEWTYEDMTLAEVRSLFHLGSDFQALKMMAMLEMNPDAWRYISR